jgi:hypothetical protein
MANRGNLSGKVLAAFGAMVMTTMSIVATFNPAVQAYASAAERVHG